MKKTHRYQLSTQWTGNTGSGTKDYQSFDRSYVITIENKPPIAGSSDPSFRGDRTKYNPEELLLASLSSCHMLWYLHLCAEAKIIVESYKDNALGVMIETASGGGYFSEVTLRPQLVLAEEWMIDKALALHEQANKLCFIANSVNFPVYHKPSCSVSK